MPQLEFFQMKWGRGQGKKGGNENQEIPGSSLKADLYDLGRNSMKKIEKCLVPSSRSLTKYQADRVLLGEQTLPAWLSRLCVASVSALKDPPLELDPISTYMAEPTPSYIRRATCMRMLSLQNCLYLDYLDLNYQLMQKLGSPTIVSLTLSSKIS